MVAATVTSTSLFSSSPPPLRPHQNLPKTTGLRCSHPEAHPGPTASISTSGLVLAAGAAGSWDAADVASPVVKRYLTDSGDRWLMWYASAAAAGVATSGDGIHWHRGSAAADAVDDVGECMLPSTDWWAFDTAAVAPSDVLTMSNSKLRSRSAVYWLYYTGFTNEKVHLPIDTSPALAAAASSFRSLPGLAISQDGRHWARIEGDHHSGALFDAGAPGEWDAPFVAAPKVVYHGDGDLRMYYHSFDEMSQRFAVGIARSRDGIRWAKSGKLLDGGSAGSFDEAGVRHGHVVRDHIGRRYVMAYEGIDVSGRTSIGLAESDDGLKNWRRCGDLPVLSPLDEEDAWDGIGVGSPCLVQLDGSDEWRIYYVGVGKDARDRDGRFGGSGAS